MRGRGGRGGRGGRYGGRSSVTQELIRDNLEDVGYDIVNSTEDRSGGPAPLYPPPSNNLCTVLLNPPMPESEHKYAIEKTMEFSKRCYQSHYNLDNIINHNNAYTYPTNTNNNTSSSNKTVHGELLGLICLGEDEGYPYVPVELIKGTNKKIFNVVKKRDVDLRRFEEAEEGKTEGGIRNYDGENKNEDEEEDNDNMELEQDELELDDDYIVDHNESEDENDDDNEGAIY